MITIKRVDHISMAHADWKAHSAWLERVRSSLRTLTRPIPDDKGRRRPGDAVRVVLAAIALALLALHAHDPTAAERAFARFLRSLPDDADTFVLTLPMVEKQELLALVVFIGGLSAATGMVIVETIALSTMVCNDLVMPVLLRMRALGLTERPDRIPRIARGRYLRGRRRAPRRRDLHRRDPPGEQDHHHRRDL